MKVVQQTSTQLTLKELPWLVWLITAIFAATGVIVLTSGNVLLGSICLACVPVMLLRLGQINTCDFNTNTGQFTLKRQGLLGKTQIRHPLGEIVDVQIESDKIVESRGHRINIVLSSREEVPLTTVYNPGYRRKQEIRQLIRSFLGLA